jgi:hypothetical protein
MRNWSGKSTVQNWSTKRSFQVAAIVAMIWMSLAIAFAQTAVKATVTGTITDSAGAAVQGARVIVTNQAMGTISSTTTNEVGRYTVLDLASGNYDVAIEKSGFQRCMGKSVALDPAQTLTFSCVLKPGSIDQTVEVAADSLQVETETAQVSTTLTAEQVQEVPVNGRNWSNLLGLVPGVVGGSEFNSFNAGFGKIFSTQGTHVNGLADTDNNILVEGVTSQRTRGNAVQVAPPTIDAISEISIVTTGYMPEFSRAGGGQIAVQLRSGTPEYHGSLYEYNRNTVYDAADAFSGVNSPINYNNFGFTVGGPVIPHKKKLFFFYSQEFVKWPASAFDTTFVPTAQQHQGNFSALCPGVTPSTPSDQIPAQCPTVPGYLNNVADPNTGQILAGGQAFPNNTIAQKFWSPNGAAMLSLYPTATIFNNANFNFGFTAHQLQNEDTESLKIDYDLDSIKSHLSGTLRRFSNLLVFPDEGGSTQLTTLNWHFPSRAASVDFLTTLSSSLVNDFTVGAQTDPVRSDLAPGALANGLNRGSLGINFPYIFGNASKDFPGKVPSISIQGLDQFQQFISAYPSRSTGHLYQIQDVITKTLKTHTMKFGVWIEHDGENDADQLGFASQNLNGFFNFFANSSQNPNTTGSSVADLLLGNFDSYTEFGFRNETAYSSWQTGLFAQDTWKVNSRFTVQGGLRWDFFPPYSAKFCNFALFEPQFYSAAAGVQQVVDPATGNVTGGNRVNGMVMPCSQLPASANGAIGLFGQPLTASNHNSIQSQLMNAGILRGLPPGIVQSHYKNFEPRLGFAWDPFGHGKTSIRAGGGVFYSHFTLNDATLPGSNAPFQSSATIFGGRVDCPGFALTASGTCTTTTAPGVSAPLSVSGQNLSNNPLAIYQWSLTAEQMLPKDFLVSLGYVGNLTRHGNLLENLNEMRPGTFNNNPGAPSLNAQVPFPGFGAITFSANANNSNYNALQASLQRRMKNGLLIQAAYTYAQAFDFADEYSQEIPNHYCVACNYGPSGFNRHHQLNVSYVYVLPFFKNSNAIVRTLLGGWELAGVFSVHSGTPFAITGGFADPSLMGFDDGEFAQVIPGCNPNNGPRTRTAFFNSACITNPAPGTLGNAGKGVVWGPRYWNDDFALYKNGSVWGEKLHYQIKGQAFNVLNHTNWSGLDTNFGDQNFGGVTSDTPARALEIGAKIVF